jgi:hypothetical protein
MLDPKTSSLIITPHHSTDLIDIAYKSQVQSMKRHTQHRHGLPTHSDNLDLLMIAMLERRSQTLPLYSNICTHFKQNQFHLSMQLYVYVDNVDFNLPISEMSLLNRFE